MKKNKGKIKVSAFYTSGEGKTFDMDYYINKHVPMVIELFGDALLGVSIEKGLVGIASNSVPNFTTVINLYFESVEMFRNSFNANAEEIMGDIPKYTNIEPIIQIGEVVFSAK